MVLMPHPHTTKCHSNYCEKCYTYPLAWLFVLLLVIIATIAFNILWLGFVLPASSSPLLFSQLGTTNGQISNNNHTINEIEISLQNYNNISNHHSSDKGSSKYTERPSSSSFFDCNHTTSKCTYFTPQTFFHQYYITHIKLIHDDERYNQFHQKYGFEHEQYLLWQKDIGLQNANLPALDSFSWWSSSSSSSWSNREDKFIQHEIQEYLRLPQNITYIHVHKCGGTSIQGALYKRARSIRNTHFHIIDNTINNSIVSNSGEHQQSDSNNITMTMKADIHTYKHSFGGGSLEKKRQWDRQRLDHIKSIAIQQQSTLSTTNLAESASAVSLFPIFTVVRDPIIRFFSAIQQVMQYNTEFREKCLFEPPSLSKKEQSSFSLLKTKLKNSKEEEEEEIQLQKKFRQQTILCAIQDMKETNYRNDVHLLPLASHFRLYSIINVPILLHGTVT